MSLSWRKRTAVAVGCWLIVFVAMDGVEGKYEQYFSPNPGQGD